MAQEARCQLPIRVAYASVGHGLRHPRRSSGAANLASAVIARVGAWAPLDLPASDPGKKRECTIRLARRHDVSATRLARPQAERAGGVRMELPGITQT